MSVSLQVKDNEVQGTCELIVPPGTLANARDGLVDDELTEPLYAVANDLGVVLAADPHKYTRQLNGKDEQGRTRFVVHARAEGGRLVPVRGGKLRARG